MSTLAALPIRISGAGGVSMAAAWWAGSQRATIAAPVTAAVAATSAALPIASAKADRADTASRLPVGSADSTRNVPLPSRHWSRSTTNRLISLWGLE